jgi:hypothetical protein
MPALTVPLLPAGALVRFVVAVSGPRHNALVASGQPVPAPVVGQLGLIDTGASGTLIDTQLIQSLGLMPTGSVLAHSPTTGTTPVSFNQYDVAFGIAMDHNMVHVCQWTMPIIEADLSGQNLDALIGRDILSRALLVYDGVQSRVTLAF